MRTLIEEIVEGEPPAGEMLPREVDLVERFGVSRGVVREFVRGLEERGLVSVKHGRGATVRPPIDWDVFDPEVLGALVAAPDGRQFLAEAVECQRVFEAEAAALAAARADRDQLDELGRALESMVGAAARSARSESAARRYREADLDFHRAIVRASGNRILVRLSEPLHRALAEAGAEVGDRKRRVAEHERILAAIAARDADGARAAMQEHLAAGSRRLRKRPR
jgi:GntR family transcriptional regulator, transcriptional repressor for pyruvate dehydrogenase complex